MRYIFTCNAKYRELAVYEIEKFDKSSIFQQWLDEGVGLFESSLKPNQLRDLIICIPIIFIRHVFRVDKFLDGNNIQEQIVQLCIEKINKEEICSIQTRFAQGSKKDLNLTSDIVNLLIKLDMKIDVESSEKIISVYGTNDGVYIGISDAKNNLSHWKGGMPHYSFDSSHGFISRAEFKLKEAIDTFHINIDYMKTGADLGAAPGGWTKVLAEKGIEVVSIDPSYLNKAIEKRKNVKYYHMLVEQYLELSEDVKFDIVVNDMKMDVKKSINIINKFYYKICDKGIVIITFKLPHEVSYKSIVRYLTMFNGYDIIGCRQLFHNRSEITVVVEKNEDLRRDIVQNTAKKKMIPIHGNRLSKKLARKQNRKKAHIKI